MPSHFATSASRIGLVAEVADLLFRSRKNRVSRILYTVLLYFAGLDDVIFNNKLYNITHIPAGALKVPELASVSNTIRILSVPSVARIHKNCDDLCPYTL